MEFNEKLQELRKQKGLTQEQLGEVLYVSRTAISKWESGRGYPSIESLKQISKFFNVSVDQLLSCDELLSAFEQDDYVKETRIRNLLFGLIDIGVIIFLFLPIFAQKVDGVIQEVWLFSLTKKQTYIKIAYFLIIFSSSIFGILQLLLMNVQSSFWQKNKQKISLILNALSVILFSISLQPYAVVLSFLFLTIKTLTLIKN